MRIAFTLIGGKNWTGGYNYLLNLVRALATNQAGQVTSVIFCGADAEEKEIAPFAGLEGVETVRSPLLNRSRHFRSLMAATVLGRDLPLRALFHEYRVDVVFESARFFGWRLDLPAIAWIPDFQHRYLPHLFTRIGYLRRELGFRAQVIAGRAIMLSSEDARRSCERLYPSTVGRASTVHFAVPPGPVMSAAHARSVADSYRLPRDFFFMPNQFWVHKNHLLVLEALSELRARGVGAVVAASGNQVDPRDPSYFSNVQNTAHKGGLDAQFRILGMIPRDHVPALMYASMAVLNPSRFEGWSTSVEEAKSLGVRLILSDLDVHREQAGADALYFERASPKSLADTLERFVPSDPEERERKMLKARSDAETRVRRFAADFTALADRCLRTCKP